MITAWTNHCKTEEEKEQFIKSLTHSRWILDHLNELLIDIDISLGHQEVSPKAYDNPNWAYKQAHLNGFRQCLMKVSNLINLDQKEPDDRKSTRRKPGRPSSPN